MTRRTAITLLATIGLGSCRSNGEPPAFQPTGGHDAAATGGPDGASPADAAPRESASSPNASPFATDECAPGLAGTLLCDTLRPLPREMAETGLFPAAPDFTTRPAGLRAYQPRPELWSDGLAKERYLLLPRGARIDNRKADAWVFPVGTVIIKTFFDDGPGGRRPIETRLIRRTTDPFFEYDFAVYRWDLDGRNATLLDIQGDRRTPVMVTVGGGKPSSHEIPSRIDCGKCHEPNAAVASTFIGFDELRLNWTLPGATRTQLAEMAALGVLMAPLPAAPAQINEPDPVLREVMSFVMGNCVHCHNGSQGIVDLRPNVFVANTIGLAPDSPGTTAPAGWKRVIPGDPARSVLHVQTSRMVPIGLNPMPPVGVAVAEPTSLARMKAWICGLPGAPRPPLAACRP
jgi:hypothetical protein